MERVRRRVEMRQRRRDGKEKKQGRDTVLSTLIYL